LEIEVDLSLGAIDVGWSRGMRQFCQYDGNGEPGNDGLKSPLPVVTCEGFRVVLEGFEQFYSCNEDPIPSQNCRMIYQLRLTVVFPGMMVPKKPFVIDGVD
jgi:hypothetical protein